MCQSSFYLCNSRLPQAACDSLCRYRIVLQISQGVSYRCDQRGHESGKRFAAHKRLQVLASFAAAAWWCCSPRRIGMKGPAQRRWLLEVRRPLAVIVVATFAIARNCFAGAKSFSKPRGQDCFDTSLRIDHFHWRVFAQASWRDL